VGLGGGFFYPSNTSAAMTGPPPHRLGVASATLATLRQTGMVLSLALALAVAAASIPRNAMLQLFVGKNIALGSQVTQSFVLGMHSAFLLSFALCMAAAVLSVVRGREQRGPVAPPPGDGSSIGRADKP
jgi:hypothetical protein